MKQLYRWIIWLLFVHTGMLPMQSSAIPTDDTLKFGAKLGYVCGFYLIEDFFNCFAPEVFITYHSKTIDRGPRYPLFGFWGSRYTSCAVQAGICYKSIHVRVPRCNIDPQAAWLSYPRREKIGDINLTMSIKTLSIPILLKNYIGKNRKFCITTGIAPLFIFSVYKKDWVAALADQPGQELLKETIYKNNAIYRPNKKLYDYYLDPKHKSDRDAFYKIWENRKEKEKRTYLSVSSVFNGRIGLELAPLGIEYEADGGFILHWDLLHFSFFGKSNVALSSIFSIGYNLNKLLHYDIHHKNKAERSHH